MSEIRDFTDLIVWQKAIAVGKLVYELTSRFPREERFGLTLQVRKAVLSVSSNIAEGHARQRREFGYFLGVARGSMAEVESQLLFAVAVGYLTAAEVAPVRDAAGEIHRMIASLTSKLS